MAQPEQHRADHVSKLPTKEYRDNFARVFGREDRRERGRTKWILRHGKMVEVRADK